MTLLTVWDDTTPETPVLRTEDPAVIGPELAALGVRYEQWPVKAELEADAGSDEVLAAYKAEVDELVEAEQFTVVDVVRLVPQDDPAWVEKAAAARAKFLNEHTHDDDDEVRFFVEGSGVFYLHLNGKVYGVLCEAGDLLGVPRGTTHWFDMGTRPRFAAIRFFHDEDGWVGTFTGSDISTHFPDYDTLAAGRATA